jgi:hypothetical protein
MLRIPRRFEAAETKSALCRSTAWQVTRPDSKEQLIGPPKQRLAERTMYPVEIIRDRGDGNG